MHKTNKKKMLTFSIFKGRRLNGYLAEAVSLVCDGKGYVAPFGS